MRRQLALLTMGLVLVATPSRADLKKRFGSDEANVENVRALIEEDVHVEVSAGLWFAYLDGGLTQLVSKADSDDATSQAIDSIGAGKGTVRDIRFALQVYGNEAYFSYLSDQLWASAEDEVDARVGDPVAKELILQIAGELRPDLGDLLGPDAKVWLRAEYGNFEGDIQDPQRFSTRNGVPWFGDRTAGWSTKYFSVEAGVYPEGRLTEDAWNHWRGKRKEDLPPVAGDEGLGLFGRYTTFSRPAVLGFGDDDGRGYILEDADLTLVGLGIRYETQHCGTFCIRVSGNMIPFTGLVQLDLGRWGTTRGVAFGGGGELRGSLPIRLVGDFAVAPYAAFRTEWLMPILSSHYSTDIDEVQLWSPDYLLWGPSLGIMGTL